MSRIILNIDLHSVIIISTVFDRKQNGGIFMPEKENEETESIISSVSPLNEPETWITPAEAIYTMKLSV